MTKKIFVSCSLILSQIISLAQECDCLKNYNWVKSTFEANDAGYQYALDVKGEAAYWEHNKRILIKVEGARTISECTPILYEWLEFFRSGHIAIRLNEDYQQLPPSGNQSPIENWESYKVSEEDFKKYLDRKFATDFEGIWEAPPYKVGIIEKDGGYLGFILESGVESWKPGDIKFKFNTSEMGDSGVYYMRDRSAVEFNRIELIGNNHLQIGDFLLNRQFPLLKDDPKYEQYFKSQSAELPYFEKLDNSTLYFRIPSFSEGYKGYIDSLITDRKNEILSTKNLIIDIRNNGGGSDASYAEIIPFLYTNPIRVVGVEYLSTKLNNQRMLDFINNPAYGFSDDDKKWAKDAYDKLESKLGQFVNLNDEVASIGTLDTIYPYPKNVGIIINQGNGSTAEQFLLESRQSKKVKLFGVTTFGVLDISNMYFVDSPCNEFQLGYSLSRSMRIPSFAIDDKGIQPDFFLDEGIPQYDWTEYVKSILNSW
ncbi:MAG: S41 family peptidase [Flavobacteriales bacterium]